jgi:hypothetical protein
MEICVFSLFTVISLICVFILIASCSVFLNLGVLGSWEFSGGPGHVRIHVRVAAVWSAGPVRVYLVILLVWVAGQYGFSVLLFLFRWVRYD